MKYSIFFTLMMILALASCGGESSAPKDCKVEDCEDATPEESAETFQEPVIINDESNLNSCVQPNSSWRTDWTLIQYDAETNGGSFTQNEGYSNVWEIDSLQNHGEGNHYLEQINRSISLTSEPRAIEFWVKGSQPGIIYSEVLYHNDVVLYDPLTVTTEWSFHSTRYTPPALTPDALATATIHLGEIAGNLYIYNIREGACLQ